MNKGLASEDANREFERMIIVHVSGNFKVLNSTLHDMINPFDEISKDNMGKIIIMIPNVHNATLVLDGITC